MMSKTTGPKNVVETRCESDHYELMISFSKIFILSSVSREIIFQNQDSYTECSDFKRSR